MTPFDLLGRRQPPKRTPLGINPLNALGTNPLDAIDAPEPVPVDPDPFATGSRRKPPAAPVDYDTPMDWSKFDRDLGSVSSRLAGLRNPSDLTEEEELAADAAGAEAFARNQADIAAAKKRAQGEYAATATRVALPLAAGFASGGALPVLALASLGAEGIAQATEAATGSPIPTVREQLGGAAGTTIGNVVPGNMLHRIPGASTALGSLARGAGIGLLEGASGGATESVLRNVIGSGELPTSEDFAATTGMSGGMGGAIGALLGLATGPGRRAAPGALPQLPGPRTGPSMRPKLPDLPPQGPLDDIIDAEIIGEFPTPKGLPGAEPAGLLEAGPGGPPQLPPPSTRIPPPPEGFVPPAPRRFGPGRGAEPTSADVLSPEYLSRVEGTPRPPSPAAGPDADLNRMLFGELADPTTDVSLTPRPPAPPPPPPGPQRYAPGGIVKLKKPENVGGIPVTAVDWTNPDRAVFIDKSGQRTEYPSAIARQIFPDIAPPPLEAPTAEVPTGPTSRNDLAFNRRQRPEPEPPPAPPQAVEPEAPPPPVDPTGDPDDLTAAGLRGDPEARAAIRQRREMEGQRRASDDDITAEQRTDDIIARREAEGARRQDTAWSAKAERRFPPDQYMNDITARALEGDPEAVAGVRQQRIQEGERRQAGAPPLPPPPRPWQGPQPVGPPLSRRARQQQASDDDIDAMLRQADEQDAAVVRQPAPEPTIEQVPEGDIQNNASGESSASVEAMNRQESMRSRGEEFVMVDRARNITPLIGPDAVDIQPRPGQTKGILRADGSFERVMGDGPNPKPAEAKRLATLRERDRQVADRLDAAKENTQDFTPGSEYTQSRFADADEPAAPPAPKAEAPVRAPEPEPEAPPVKRDPVDALMEPETPVERPPRGHKNRPPNTEEGDWRQTGGGAELQRTTFRNRDGVEKDAVEVRFTDAPDAGTRAALKEAGFIYRGPSRKWTYNVPASPRDDVRFNRVEDAEAFVDDLLGGRPPDTPDGAPTTTTKAPRTVDEEIDRMVAPKKPEPEPAAPAPKDETPEGQIADMGAQGPRAKYDEQTLGKLSEGLNAPETFTPKRAAAPEAPKPEARSLEPEAPTSKPEPEGQEPAVVTEARANNRSLRFPEQPPGQLDPGSWEYRAAERVLRDGDFPVVPYQGPLWDRPRPVAVVGNLVVERGTRSYKRQPPLKRGRGVPMQNDAPAGVDEITVDMFTVRHPGTGDGLFRAASLDQAAKVAALVDDGKTARAAADYHDHIQELSDRIRTLESEGTIQRDSQGHWTVTLKKTPDAPAAKAPRETPAATAKAPESAPPAEPDAPKRSRATKGKGAPLDREAVGAFIRGNPTAGYEIVTNSHRTMGLIGGSRFGNRWDADAGLEALHAAIDAGVVPRARLPSGDTVFSIKRAGGEWVAVMKNGDNVPLRDLVEAQTAPKAPEAPTADAKASAVEPEAPEAPEAPEPVTPTESLAPKDGDYRPSREGVRFVQNKPTSRGQDLYAYKGEDVAKVQLRQSTGSTWKVYETVDKPNPDGKVYKYGGATEEKIVSGEGFDTRAGAQEFAEDFMAERLAVGKDVDLTDKLDAAERAIHWRERSRGIKPNATMRYGMELQGEAPVERIGELALSRIGNDIAVSHPGSGTKAFTYSSAAEARETLRVLEKYIPKGIGDVVIRQKAKNAAALTKDVAGKVKKAMDDAIAAGDLINEGPGFMPVATAQWKESVKQGRPKAAARAKTKAADREPLSVDEARAIADDVKADPKGTVEREADAAMKNRPKDDDDGIILGGGLGGLQTLYEKNPYLFWQAMRTVGGGLIGAVTADTEDGSSRLDNIILGAIAGGLSGPAARALRRNAPKVYDALKDVVAPSRHAGPRGSLPAVRRARAADQDIGRLDLVAWPPNKVVPDVWKKVRPVLSVLHEAMDGLPDNAPPQLRDIVRRMHIREALGYIRHESAKARRNNHPRLVRYLEGMNAELRGAPIGMEKFMGEVLTPALARKILRGTTDGIYHSLLGWNIGAAAANLTQNVLAAPYTGGRNLAKGVLEAMTKKGRAETSFLNLKRRPMDQSQEREFNQWVEQYLEVSQTPMRWSDSTNRRMTYLAAKKQAIERYGASEADARAWALDITEQVQGVPGDLGANPLLRSLGPMRALIRYPLLWMSLVDDLAKHPDPGVKLRALGLFSGAAALTYMGAVNAMDYLVPRMQTPPAVRGAIDVVQHTSDYWLGTALADHDMLEHADPTSTENSLFPVYPTKVARIAGRMADHGMEDRDIVNRGGRKARTITAKEDLQSVLSYTPAARAAERDLESEQYGFAAKASQEQTITNRKARRRAGELLAAGDRDGAMEYLIDQGFTGQQRVEFLREYGRTPTDRARRATPRRRRDEFDEMFGIGQDDPDD